MGFFSSLLGIGRGKKSKIGQSGQSDTSKPFHTHSGSSGNKNTSATAAGTSATPSTQTYEPRSDGGQQKPVFMGKGQVDKFSSFTDPSSVDRSGGAAPKPDDSISLDPVGIETAMNPPMAVPVPPDVDKQGVQSLYS